MDLFGCEFIAIDGSKFSTVNHNDRNYTKDKLKNLLKQINEQIELYFKQLEQGDHAESKINRSDSKEDLQQKIDNLKRRQIKLEQLQQQLAASGESQISLTDADSRMMKSNKGSDVSYNVQIATDDKHKLIVDVDVTNDINDMNQLSNMAINAKEIPDVDEMEQRVLENPDFVKRRKELVEHPFGTIKHWMNQGYFLMRGFEKVNGEMHLTALCYNIKRVLNILDVKELDTNVQALAVNYSNNLLLTLKFKSYNKILALINSGYQIFIEIIVSKHVIQKFV